MKAMWFKPAQSDTSFVLWKLSLTQCVLYLYCSKLIFVLKQQQNLNVLKLTANLVHHRSHWVYVFRGFEAQSSLADSCIHSWHFHIKIHMKRLKWTRYKNSTSDMSKVTTPKSSRFIVTDHFSAWWEKWRFIYKIWKIKRSRRNVRISSM